jgi:hypothetical protein
MGPQLISCLMLQVGGKACRGDDPRICLQPLLPDGCPLVHFSQLGGYTGKDYNWLVCNMPAWYHNILV